MLRRTVGIVWNVDRAGCIAAVGIQAVGALSGVGVVLASKLALDSVLSSRDQDASRGLVVALALLAVVVALSSSVGVLQSLQQRILGERVAQQMWRGVLQVSSSVDLVAWEDTEFLERLDRVRMNALSRPTSVISSLMSLGGALIGLTGMLIALATISPFLVPVLVAVGVPVLLLNRLASRIEFAFALRTNHVARRRQYVKSILTARGNAAEVRAFESARHLQHRHRTDDLAYLGQLLPHVRRRQALGLASTLISAAGLAVTLVLVVVLVQHGALTLAQAGAAAIAARLLGSQMTTALSAASGLVEAVPFLRDMESFLDEIALDQPVGQQRRLSHALELRGVSFSYPGHGPAVDGVHVSLPQGQVVALVGENGSGKSTLAKLVGGLFEPDAGEVSWDGGLAESADLRSSVTVLFQDFIRYQMSARDNIAIADTRRPTDDERVRLAARQADIDQAIMSLPKGYDTVLGQELEAGTDLSGGQWQRVALARALYRDSSVVILDEPTAAMDPRAEAQLFGDVRRLLAGRTALLISHRFSSVRSADYIYVMERGSVIEEGTHDDLVALDGTYSELYSLQAAAYLE